jgi:plasmid replication initiation protein
MRLLMAALMQVKSKDEIDFRTRYYVSANALSELTGAKANHNYKELKRAADHLMASTLTVKSSPEGEPLKKYRKINLVSSCEYEDGTGTVGLRFTEEVTPYISSLKSRFTQYQARYVMPMRSGYGIRLYELCLQWMGDEREFSVEDFRATFELEKKYSAIAELKRNVIEPALKDINEFSDIVVTFGQRKRGRKITHFQFKIAKKRGKEVQEQLPIKGKAKPKIDNAYIEKHAQPGESYEQAAKRLRDELNRK